MASSLSSRPRGTLFALSTGVALCALAFAGCTSKMKNTVGGGSNPPPVQATIDIVPGAFNKGMMAFAPDTVTVHVNDTVRMHNGDSIVHDIEPLIAGNPGWGNLSAGQDKDTQVTATGTFTYVCAIGGHTMSGTLIVIP